MRSRTKPNPAQPERCPSIDTTGTLQCGRRIHDDDQCQFGGIAWRKDAPRVLFDSERLELIRAALANHPRACDKHDEDEPVSCGWKSAVLDVQRALDAP